MRYLIIVSLFISSQACAVQGSNINTLSPRGDILEEYEIIQPLAEVRLNNMLSKTKSKKDKMIANVNFARRHMNNKDYTKAMELLNNYDDQDLLAYKSLLYKLVLGNRISEIEIELENIYANVFATIGISVFNTDDNCRNSLKYLIPVSIKYRFFEVGKRDTNILSIIGNCEYQNKNYQHSMKLRQFIYKNSNNFPLRHAMSAYSIANLHYYLGSGIEEIMLWLHRSFKADKQFIQLLKKDSEFHLLTSDKCFKEFFDYYTEGREISKCVKVKEILIKN